MEIIIKLTMYKNKSLKISVNDEHKHTIEVQPRTISADVIFKIIDFKVEDHYSVISVNESGTDGEVLKFFVDLFKQISEKVNLISNNIDSKNV